MQYGIQGSTTLWDFGRMETESERAALLVREKESLIREQEEGLAFRVARAYLKVLGAQEMSDLALRQIENATRKYNQVQQNYQRGLRPEYDLVRAEVDLGRARVTKKSRDDELAIARLQLALLLALEDRMDVRLEGDLRRVPSLSKTLADSFAGPSVAAVFETRRLQRAANALEESAISAKLWPLVGASAGAAWSRGTTLPETGDSGLKTTLTGAVNVSWDIPWNGAYRDDSMRVALRDRELALSEEQELRTRREKSRLARTRLEVSVEQVALLEKQNLLSEKNLGIVRQKYDAGKASATELSVAEDEALNGQTELIRSRTSVAEALVDLAEANGVATVGSLFAKE
jgi:outer membrane protein TolC